MIKVKISTNTDLPIINQTPGRKGIWNDCQFFINDDLYDCDYWFILYGIDEPLVAKCPTENMYFVCGEPPSIHVCKKSFINQFSNLFSVQEQKYQVKRTIPYSAGLWMIGAHFINGRLVKYDKGYDELKYMNSVHKSKLLSVISSNKNWTCGHRQRLAFIEKLQMHFGQNIDIFGRGIKDFECKWDAIAPYKYHIVIENDCLKNYFTEKLMDSYLGEAYPIYYGCNNIQEYYSEQSMTRIDINNPEEAIFLIEKTISDNMYEKFHEELLKAKGLTLDCYNIFAVIANEIKKREQNSFFMAKKQFIYPENINFIEKQIMKMKKIFY